ncbi:MAG: hypothetical protein R6W83_12035, partial [Cryobacterium sp.]
VVGAHLVEGVGVGASRAGRPREAKNVATFFAYEQKKSFGGFERHSRLTCLDTARVGGVHLVEGLGVVVAAVEIGGDDVDNVFQAKLVELALGDGLDAVEGAEDVAGGAAVGVRVA